MVSLPGSVNEASYRAAQRHQQDRDIVESGLACDPAVPNSGRPPLSGAASASAAVPGPAATSVVPGAPARREAAVNAKQAEARLGEGTDTGVVWRCGRELSLGAAGGAVQIAAQAVDGRGSRTMLRRRVGATAVYDNRLQPRPVGARAVGVDQLRLLYQADTVEIDLEVTDSVAEGRLRMLGQVTADDGDLAHAWVIAEGPAGRVEAEVDELGQFALDGLVAGRHRLEIGLTSTLVEISEVLI